MSEAAQVQLILSVFALLGIIANNVSSFLASRAQKRTEVTLEAQNAKLETVATGEKLQQVHESTNGKLDKLTEENRALREELRRVNATGTATPTTARRASDSVTQTEAGEIHVREEKP